MSVVMPFRNAERFLEEAVNSVLEQTFADFELILIDDASTDGTAAVLQGITDPRVRMVRNRERRGIVANLNLGLSLAQAELVARMDGDDVCLPERLQQQVLEMQHRPEIGLLGSWYAVIDSEGRQVELRRKPIGVAAVRAAVWRHSPFCHPSVIFRKAVVLGVGGYREGHEYVEDLDLWFRLLDAGVLADNLPQPLLRYRVHGASTATRGRALARQEWRLWREMARTSAHGPRPLDVLIMVGRTALGLVLTGQRKQSFESVIASVMNRIGRTSAS